jgi:predicted XRE-type DNA-binding protein
MTTKPRRSNEASVERGSGNVYADLGFKDADAMLAKARIVARIGQLLKEQDLTQAAAARVLGVNQPKVSALLRGHFQGYSQERLIGLLNRLGCDVEIVVKRRRRKNAAGQVSVVFA